MPLHPPAPIESSRLWIRVVQAGDIEPLMAVNGDAEVTRWLPYAAWQSSADGNAWFERMAALGATGTALQFVVVEKSSAAVIGTCLLFRHAPASGRAELGYVLGRQHWGQGLMHEALSALFGFAFGACGLRRLEAEVHPDNLPSNRLLGGLGFAHEGLLRQRWVAKGVAHDTHIHGLLRHEWPPAARRDQAAR